MKRLSSFAVSLYLLLVSGVVLSAPGAPAIHLPTADGVMDLSQYNGKVVYLDFWASWCDPCRLSFPWMAEIKQKYGSQGLEIVAVNLDKEREKADEFLKSMNINFVVAFDESGETAEKYNLQGMPGSYLIGRDGVIHGTHLGFREHDKQKLETAIQSLLTRN